MFLPSCQPAPSTSSSLPVMTPPLWARECNYCANPIAQLFLPPLPSLSPFLAILSLSGNYSKWVSLKGGWQAAFGTVLNQEPFHQRGPCEHALDASQSDHPAVCLWRNSGPGMQGKLDCRQADCSPSLTCLSWLKKGWREITCLAPDGISIFFFKTHTYKDVYYFLFKSVCLSNIVINVIWSVLETFWNMCKCNKASGPGGKIRWIF